MLSSACSIRVVASSVTADGVPSGNVTSATISGASTLGKKMRSTVPFVTKVSCHQTDSYGHTASDGWVPDRELYGWRVDDFDEAVQGAGRKPDLILQ